MAKDILFDSLKKLRRPGDCFTVKTDKDRKRALQAVSTLKKWGKMDGIEISTAKTTTGEFVVYVMP